jgi:hypothetical protein
MTLALGTFACSGNNIFVLSEIESEEEMRFDVNYRGGDYTIIIRPETKTLFLMQDETKDGAGQISQNLINVILKNAFRETNLTQIGKAPHFFDCDPKSSINIDKLRMRVFPGYKATTCINEIGCTIVIDSMFKFMSTSTCLDRMNELK